MNQYLLRVKDGVGSHFTKGKIYRVNEKGKVADDQGLNIKPWSQRKDFWTDLGEHESQYFAEEHAKKVSDIPIAWVVPRLPVVPPVINFSKWKTKVILPKGFEESWKLTHNSVYGNKTCRNLHITGQDFDPVKQLNSEEPSMKIKTITYVNGTDVTKLSTEEAISLIRKSKERIDELQTTLDISGGDSTFLKNQLDEETSSLEELLTVLDKTVDGD